MKKAFTINCNRDKKDFEGYEEILKNNIYQGIEIFYPYNVSDEQALFYTNSVKNLYNLFPNIEIILHLPHGKTNSLTDEFLENSYELMINTIKYASQFKVKKLTLHLGAVKEGKKRELYIKEIVDVLKNLCDFSSNYQMNIMIENMPAMNELGFSPQEILQIIEKVNRTNIKFILDTGHAFVSKYPICEFVFTLKDYLYHIHFNDCDGKRDEHKRMNLGKINFKELFEALAEINYDQFHCMEVIFKEYTELIDFASDLDLYDIFYKK